MCFSAEVSFGSAVVLISVGACSLRAALRKAPWFWPLAVVPCLFGVQQASEGLVWLGLDRKDGRLVLVSAKVYLFFALAFWPTWFSLSAALIEPTTRMRAILAGWTALSTVWFFVAFLPAVAQLDLTAVRVAHHSIRYEAPDTGAPALQPLEPSAQRSLYALTAAVPLLATSVRRILLIPVGLTLVSGAAAEYLSEHAFTSVWCLWSALASVTLWYSVLVAPRDRRVVRREDPARSSSTSA
jgi:hypothetical protein